MAKIEDMSMEERLLLTLATMVPGKPQGKEPSLEDLESWRRGEIEGARAEEIASHIANCRACCMDFMSLREEEQKRRERTRAFLAQELGEGIFEDIQDAVRSTRPWWRRWGDWLASWRPNELGEEGTGAWSLPLAWYGGGLVAVMTLVLSVTVLLNSASTPWVGQIAAEYRALGQQAVLMDEDLLWNPAGVGKGIGHDDPEFRRAWEAFRYGIRNGLERLPLPPIWQAFKASLPASSPACGDPSCRTNTETLNAVGQWGVLAYVQCRRLGTVPPDALRRQTELAGEMADALTGSGVTPFRRHLLAVAEARDAQGFCRAVLTLLALAKP